MKNCSSFFLRVMLTIATATGWATLSRAATAPTLGAVISTVTAPRCGDEQARFAEGRRLYLAHQYLLSALHFSLGATQSCDANLAAQALLAYAQAMAQLGELDESAQALRRLPPQLNAQLQAQRQSVEAFWIRPESTGPAIDLRLGRAVELWDARRRPARFESILNETNALFDLPTRSALQQHSLRLSQAPRKSRWGAGIASAMLPGAGQAYAGAWQSAAVALIFNSLFAATTWEFARKDLRAPALASGLVFSVTYLGNIVNAVDTADRFNNAQIENLDEPLRDQLFPALKF